MYTYDRAFKIVKRKRIYNIQKILFMREMRIESVSFFMWSPGIAIKSNWLASRCKKYIDILARK